MENYSPSSKSSNLVTMNVTQVAPEMELVTHRKNAQLKAVNHLGLVRPVMVSVVS